MELSDSGLSIRRATQNDLDLLISMNLQLMSDEQYDRPLEMPAVRTRMQHFISDRNFGAFLFLANDAVAGYAVMELDKTPLYLRHFFIQSEFRRKHIGTSCFKLLLKQLKTDTIDLDVMVWNTRGFGFWKSLGFSERCISMTYRPSE